MSATLPLSEADLHGLVDGHLDTGRRVDVLRRLATSSTDRSKVEAWQDQNELIRHVFLGVDKEPLPAAMKLTPPPSLHCVPSSKIALAETATPRRQRPLAGLVTMVLIAMGLGGAFMLIQSSDDGPQTARLRGTVDEALATQAAGAVDIDPGGSMTARSTAETLAGALPTTTIPDLTSAGFGFTSAETPATAPNSLVFHYRDAAADRIAVSVARAPGGDDVGPTRIGRSFAWHKGAMAFAIAGNIRPERLRAMANLLQQGGASE